MSWIEVESKIEIKERDLNDIRKKIKEIAFFVKKETKLDQYWYVSKGQYSRMQKFIEGCLDKKEGKNMSASEWMIGTCYGLPPKCTIN